MQDVQSESPVKGASPAGAKRRIAVIHAEVLGWFGSPHKKQELVEEEVEEEVEATGMADCKSAPPTNSPTAPASDAAKQDASLDVSASPRADHRTQPLTPHKRTRGQVPSLGGGDARPPPALQCAEDTSKYGREQGASTTSKEPAAHQYRPMDSAHQIAACADDAGGQMQAHFQDVQQADHGGFQEGAVHSSLADLPGNSQVQQQLNQAMMETTNNSALHAVSAE